MPSLAGRMKAPHYYNAATTTTTTTFSSTTQIDHSIINQKRLERFHNLARIVVAIVTHKLMLLCVCVSRMYVSVAKFAVYFHRKEFRRKKPYMKKNVLFYYYILSN